jgi:hypothetical protein
MKESDRLRAFAQSCLAAARSMSLLADAERLRAMAAEAIEGAKRLEMSVASRQPQSASQPVAQQQQQVQPKKDEAAGPE